MRSNILIKFKLLKKRFDCANSLINSIQTLNVLNNDNLL